MNRFIDQQQAGRRDKADQRRDQQRQADLGGLDQLTPRRSPRVMQAVGQADAQDRADQRVRAGDRQAIPPRPQIPDHARQQQREHHHDRAGRGTIDQQVDRQQIDDAKATAVPPNSTPKKLQSPE